jgi:predicted NBD/HSP70 family sugar kinase
MATASNALGEALAQLHLLGGRASRRDLTERLGCGRSAMGYLLGELVDRDLVEIDPGGSATPSARGGRPSDRVRVAGAAPVAIAAVVSAHRIAVATIGLGGRILALTERSVQQPEPEAAADVVARIALLHAADSVRVVGLGVSVPSPVRSADGFVLAALHLGWRPVAFGAQLAARLPSLPVTVENDANLAALAEHRHGAGRGSRQLLYLTTAPTGVGGGLVSEGRLFTGARGYAIEPGHVTVNPGGTPCHCGSAGCLDVEADHRALLRAAGQTSIEPTVIPQRAGELLDEAAAGAAQAMAAADVVRARLGDGLAGLINLTDPDRVVLGGTLGRLHDLAPDSLPSRMLQEAYLERDSAIPVVSGQLAEPFLLGAAERVFHPLLNDPRAAVDRDQWSQPGSNR